MEENVKSILDNMSIDLDQELEVFVDDKLFKVSMSGFFAKRLQALADWILSKEDPEKMIKIYEKMADNPEQVPTDLEAFNYETLIMLMQAIQTSGQEQGATEKTTMRKMQDANQHSAELIENASKLSSKGDA